LVSAAIIAAGLDGIERELTPPPACNENLYSLEFEELLHVVLKLCHNPSKKPLKHSKPIHCSEKNWVQKSWMNSSIKSMEWVEYSRHVSDWEIQRYTEFF
jgi:glutamine synthetase